ncbi:MAG: endonuclease VII domain-containing protein [Parcubacteria group bacterium]
MPTKEQRAEYMRKWVVAHKEQIAAYREQTREQRNARRREKYASDAKHRETVKRQVKRWQEANPEKRKSQRLRAFGITYAEFSQLMERQLNRCAICGAEKTQDGRMFPVVDHCHQTGKVRGLLCMNCNQGLGKFKDDPAILRSAADYLEINGSSGAG